MKIQEKADRVNAGTTRRSLGKSVLIWMTLISMVPLVVLAYQGYHCARQALLERAETHMVSVLVSKRALIEQWLGERRDDIEVLSKEPCLIGLCGENSAVPEGVPTSHALQTLVRQNPAYGELAAFDNNWRLVASAYSDENVAHSSPEEEVKHLAEDFDGVYFGSAHLHNNGQIGFHMLVPAKDHEGRQVGTLFANLNLTESLNLLLRDRRGLSETGKVYLISKDLLIITEPIPDSDAMAFQANANPVVRELAMLPSPHARIYDDYRGKSVLGASAYIESMGWYLVAETDAVDALAWLGMLRRRAFITGVLTLSMVFFLSVIVSRRLSYPFRQLAHTARQVSEGKVEERLAPMNIAETEEVRQAFNQMLDQLAETQRKLIQAATLASVGELTSSIVHEMRNPLSPIKMNLQALKRKVQDDNDYLELADIALSQALRLEAMLEDLLNFGRQSDIRTERTPVSQLARNVITLTQEAADSASVSVKTVNDVGARFANLDGEKMCRALCNLVLNAVQASGSGSKVTMRFSDGGSGSHSLRVSVEDQGRGLPVDARDRLFRPFFTTKEMGTGLGLANVKKIVELHGGEVTAEDGPEGGAIFRILLPGAFD